MKKGIYSIALTLALVLVIGQVYAGPIPFERLFDISNVQASRVGVDTNGNIYILDSIYMLIKKYDYTGKSKGFIRLKDKPISLSVSPSNLLYVGYGRRDCLDCGYVEIYTPDGKLINKFNGLGQPVSFAFTSNGNIYIADVNNYRIKIYDGSYKFINSFGDDPRDNTIRFVDPYSIAINEELGEIYVLDRGNLTTDPSGYYTYAWRIQVFDLNGNYKRSFGYYGLNEEGKVHTASGLVIDSAGNLYIPDWMQSIVAVYDPQGNYLGTIYDNSNHLYFPNSISIKDNRLYIASYAAKSLYVLGINNYAYLSVSPESLSATLNSSSSTTLNLRLTNSGKGDINYQISSDSNWATLSTTSGTISAGSFVDIGVTLNSEGLQNGTYNGTISIISNGGSKDVPVILNVTTPVLTVSPNSFTLIKKKGSSIEPLIAQIGISGDASNSMTWSASSDSPWLTITPTTGSSNSTVSANILVNTDLDPGTYTGHITVTAEGANGSPATITVNLEIRNSRRIAISTNLESASFTITGPATYEGSGTTYVIEDAPAGTYTVTFKHVKGYRTPKPQTGTLSEAGEVTFNGEYIPVPQGFHILASHGPGNKDDMEIRVYDIDGNLLSTIPPVKPYGYGATVQTGDINGDGINEIIIGTGPDTKAPSKVFVLDTDGNLLGQFSPFDRYGYGIEISLSDLDNDGALEIITAKTRKFAGTPLVDLKAFKYKDGQFIDTGLRLRHRGANGIRISSADLNNDGIPEVLVVPARGDAPVYVYHIDTTSTPWTGELIATYEGCNGTGGANIATGDTDGDGTQEILLACQYDTGTVVRILNNEGSLVSEFPTGSTLKDYIASGDLDEDGIAEIIIGDGPSAHKRSIKIFNPQGELLKGFDAFEDSFGVRVSTGKIE